MVSVWWEEKPARTDAERRSRGSAPCGCAEAGQLSKLGRSTRGTYRERSPARAFLRPKAGKRRVGRGLWGDLKCDTSWHRCCWP